MGAHLARDEANSFTIPTWLAERALEDGHWPKELSGGGDDSTPTSWRERLLLANLVRTRHAAEASRVQLDAIEGLGNG